MHQPRRPANVPNGKITLRCFVKQRSSEKYVAVCLQPYLVAEGNTEGQARHALVQLIPAYLEDAFRDGDFDRVMARKAPLSYRLEYCAGWLIHLVNRSFKPFITETTCCPPQHA